MIMELIKNDTELYTFNPIKRFENCAFEYENIKELEEEKDVSDIYETDYYLMIDEKITGIIDSMSYNGFSLMECINLTEPNSKNLGYTRWQLCYLKDCQMYIIIRGEI